MSLLLSPNPCLKKKKENQFKSQICSINIHSFLPSCHSFIQFLKQLGPQDSAETSALQSWPLTVDTFVLQSSNHNAVFWKLLHFCSLAGEMLSPDAFTEYTVSPVSVLLEGRCILYVSLDPHLLILFCCRNVEEKCLKMPFLIMNCQILCKHIHCISSSDFTDECWIPWKV